MSTSGPILYKYKYVIVLKWIWEFFSCESYKKTKGNSRTSRYLNWYRPSVIHVDRLLAYRVSDRPKSLYLFTKEDCQAALLAVKVEPIKLRDKERKVEARIEFMRRQKEVNKKLRQMLNMPEKDDY